MFRRLKTKGFTLIELLIVVAILAILVSFVAGFRGCSGNSSEGARSGVIIKFSNKGTLNKTWEGSLAQAQGMAPWNFTVDSADTAVIADVEKARKLGKRVDLQYIQVHLNTGYNGDTSYRVKKVDFLEGQ